MSTPAVRCPVLIIDFSEMPRLVEIRDNLIARITEAEREGWLGEVEGLTVSLSAAEEKLAQLAARKERRQSATFLGMPPFTQAGDRGRSGTEAGDRK